MDNDPEVPNLSIHNFGYMYLANTQASADNLRAAYDIQRDHGAGTKLLTPEEIQQAYPFYQLDDIILGSHNLIDEGYWDGMTVFDWWRKKARQNGVEYIQNEVTAMTKNKAGTHIESVTLATGDVISAGQIVNASGPRANRTAEMAGITIPVEPRKRFTWVFSAEEPLDRDLPLTIDPSGVHFRQDGASHYLAGGHAAYDPAVAFDDFEMDHELWLDHLADYRNPYPTI